MANVPPPQRAFRLRPCEGAGQAVYFDVCASGDDHALGTVLLGDRVPDRLKVVHPAYFYRFNHEVSGGHEPALLAWLSDLAAVNAALADVGATAVRSVSWTESVTVR